MAQQNYVLAVDQSTTSSAAFVIDHGGRVVAWAKREITQFHPEPGWVSHDPEELFRSVIAVSQEAMASAGIGPQQLAAVGITNQRETTVVWDRSTGEPVSPAIVWQCRRTAQMCDELKQRGLEPAVREKTGLMIDAYFSATKVRWLLEHTQDGQSRAESGELCTGTVDSWLLYRLTGGRVHATDVSNASRTMLFNIHTQEWDADLLSQLDIPLAMLPEVRPSSSVFGETGPGLFGAAVPIACLAGVQAPPCSARAVSSRGCSRTPTAPAHFCWCRRGSSLSHLLLA